MSRATAALFVGFAVLIAAACDKMPLTAPTQSTITLTVSTTTVPVNGTAQVTANVIEQAGTAVQNGTLVTFTMSGTPSTPSTPGNLTAAGPIGVATPTGNGIGTFDTTGAIGTFDPPEAVTHNGRAVTTFRAGAFSGTINIGAVSGGATASSIAVNVGGAAAGQVIVRAEPSSVPVTGGTSQITAVVIDVSGNALPGAPVLFSADNGTLSSSSAISDNNGEARVTLTTNRDTIVRAAVGSKVGQVTVRAVPLPSVTIALVGTTQPEAGVAANFTVTPSTAATGNALRSVVVDFGDGTQENLGAISGATTVAHTYARAGQYRVTATATDVQGLTGSSSLIIQVNERSSLSLTLTATPNPVSLGLQQGLVEFSATAAGTTAIQFYQWDFGDGASAFTSGGTTNHRYAAAGTYVVRVTVRASNGQEGFTERTVRVNP